MHNVHIKLKSCNFRSKMIMKQLIIFCIHFYLNIQKYVFVCEADLEILMLSVRQLVS